MVDALAMAVGLALLAAIAVTGPAALGIRGRAARAAAGLILCAATVVGASVVLSLMRELTRGGILLSQLLVALVSVGVWVRVRRPARPTVRLPGRRELVRTVRAHPLTTVLSAIVLASLGLEFLLAVTVAPNNWDSMGYHLSRAAYWLQYESVLQFPGGSIRQLYYPPNGEILQAWTLAVSSTDRFAQLVQWASGIGCGLCIYLGAQLLGFRRAHAVFAAGLFMVLPIVVLESTTTQNDLITAFFIASSGVFAVRGVAARSYGDLVVAALAIGLAVGTKGTALVALPSLLILVGAAAWWHRPPLKLALGGVVIAVLAVIALGSFNYVQSWEKTGSPFGKASHLTDRTDGLVPNATRGAWTFVDLPGLQVEWLDTTVQGPARAMFGDLEKENYEFTGTPTDSVDTRVQEDYTAFGPVGWLFLLPMVLFTLTWPKVDRRKRLLALCVLLFLCLFFAVVAHNAWLGRLLIVFVVLAAPLMAGFARYPALRVAVVIAALSALVPALLVNEQKQLLVADGKRNIFELDRLSQQTLVRPEQKRVVDFVDRHIPAGSTLAFVGVEDTATCGCSWDYPLFGAHRERRILRFTDPRQVSYATMRREGIRGALFAGVGPPPPPLRGVALPVADYWFVKSEPMGPG